MAAQSGVQGARQVERSAFSAFVPVLAMLPFDLHALLIICLPLVWLSLLYTTPIPRDNH